MSDFIENHYPDFKYGRTRIFNGMNPTMTNENVLFNSSFESGNLDVVIKVNELEY